MREHLKNPWFVSLTQLLSESGLASSSNNIFQDFQKHVPIMEEVKPWRFSKMVKEFIKKQLLLSLRLKLNTKITLNHHPPQTFKGSRLSTGDQ